MVIFNYQRDPPINHKEGIMWYKRILIIIVCSWVGMLNAQANKVKILEKRINNMQGLIQKDIQKRDRLQDQLRHLELSAGLIDTQLKLTHQQLKRQNTVLSSLTKQAIALNQQINQQQQTLANELRSEYILGSQPTLKLLLGQSDIRNINRNLMYYQYLNKSHSKTITAIQSTLRQIENNKQQQYQHHLELKHLANRQSIQSKQHHNLQDNRLKLIKKINNSIRKHNATLATLSENKRQLEKTLSQLESNKPVANAQGKQFQQLHGRLAWPTQGRIDNVFGQKVEGSQLSWSGILIKAKEDKPIYAIADGKVVYAKWLSGYGLLIILSHGNGYMTLYGRTHSIYKKVGDRVRAGEVIATVGKSGGYKSPALYFAIRHNAKPLNPIKWCHKG